MIAIPGGGGGSGGTLTVNAPAGVTVTASKDGKTKTATANSQGVATLKGLASGTWMVSIDDAAHDPTTPIAVQIVADCSVTIAFFSATINITYPEGSTCTATDGVSTFTAPDTSGTWTLVVPSVGTWTISNGEVSENVEITADGQTISVELSPQTFIYYYNNGMSSPAVGTWSGINIRSDEGWANGSFATTTKNMTITVNNSSYGFGATNELDLSFISELRIVATASGFAGGDFDQAVVWISPVRSTATDSNYVIKQELVTGTNTIDVSSLSGSYYLVIDAASDYSRTLVISEIYGVVNSNTKLLYYFGDTYENVTGGWKIVNGGGGNSSIKTSYMLLSATSTAGDRESSIYTNNKINTSGYSTLSVKMNITTKDTEYNQYGIWVGISNTNTVALETNYVKYTQKNTTGEQTLSVDLSSYQSEYYVKLCAGIAAAKVNAVYLE